MSTPTSRIAPPPPGPTLAALEVHAPHYPVAGSRVVVLHELLGDAHRRVSIATVALVKESPLIPVDHGPHQHGPLEPCFESLHLASCSLSRIGSTNALAAAELARARVE